MIVTPSEYAYIAEVYAKMHRTDSAEYYMRKAQKALHINDAAKQVMHHVQSLIDSNKDDYRSALENYKKYHHLSDSIAKEGKTADIAHLRNWHELEQKDNENQILQQEYQKHRRLIMILAGALVMIIALLVSSISLYKKTYEKNGELKQLHTVKDKLFSVVAHDLRTPMATLMSLLKLTNEDILDIDQQNLMLKEISNQVDDTYGLLDNLLQWSKSQMQGIVPTPVYFDIQNETQAVTNSLRNVAAAKVITINNLVEKHQIYTDRNMFTVVLRNLITNSIKYTFVKGEIILASELSGNNLIISIKDSGTGIPQEVQDKLFKLSETKSQRGTNNESGTGLGLVLCADFVKANGGDIWFTSKQGEGSTFYFSIPISR
jgi:signal transduction histidine kinase